MLAFIKNKKIILGFILLCIAFFGIGYLKTYYKERLVPLTEIAVPYFHNGDGKPLMTIKAGEDYFIRIQTKRIMTCDTGITYYFEQVSDEHGVLKRTVWFPYPTYLSKSLEGESITDRFIVIPIYLKPGTYNLVHQAVYNCGGELISKDTIISVKVIR